MLYFHLRGDELMYDHHTFVTPQGKCHCSALMIMVCYCSCKIGIVWYFPYANRYGALYSTCLLCMWANGCHTCASSVMACKPFPSPVCLQLQPAGLGRVAAAGMPCGTKRLLPSLALQVSLPNCRGQLSNYDNNFCLNLILFLQRREIYSTLIDSFEEYRYIATRGYYLLYISNLCACNLDSLGTTWGTSHSYPRVWIQETSAQHVPRWSYYLPILCVWRL